MNAAVYRALSAAITSETPAIAATVVAGDALGAELVLVHPSNVVGTLGDVTRDGEALRVMRAMLRDGGTTTLELGSARVFVEAHLPPPHLVVVGAVHIAIPLVAIAKVMGYNTTVIDARGVFATDERFPHVDRLIEAWPDEGLAQVTLHPGVAAVVLAHDEKFEDPAMEVLLRSDVGYIGAVGSRATSMTRLERLRGYGFSEADLSRIHGPVGLNLGGKSPEEIALSIFAEIVAVRNGKAPVRALSTAKSA
jgi:xanthine dehydrogenase accessory factor